MINKHYNYRLSYKTLNGDLALKQYDSYAMFKRARRMKIVISSTHLSGLKLMVFLARVSSCAVF